MKKMQKIIPVILILAFLSGWASPLKPAKAWSGWDTIGVIVGAGPFVAIKYAVSAYNNYRQAISDASRTPGINPGSTINASYTGATATNNGAQTGNSSSAAGSSATILPFNISPPEYWSLRNPATDAIAGPGGIIYNTITLALSVAGAIGIIFLIYGGLLYLLAYGSEERVTKAKNTILWAIAGVVIILLAKVVIYEIWTLVTDVPLNFFI